jgi:hypothetical protein
MAPARPAPYNEYLSPMPINAGCNGSTMARPFTISDLRQCPEFFDTVADRIWRASWKATGTPLDYITGRLNDNLNAEPLPIALVAHDGAKFFGTASVIASDLEERPQLGTRRHSGMRALARRPGIQLQGADVWIPGSREDARRNDRVVSVRRHEDRQAKAGEMV